MASHIGTLTGTEGRNGPKSPVIKVSCLSYWKVGTISTRSSSAKNSHTSMASKLKVGQQVRVRGKQKQSRGKSRHLFTVSCQLTLHRGRAVCMTEGAQTALNTELSVAGQSLNPKFKYWLYSSTLHHFTDMTCTIDPGRNHTSQSPTQCQLMDTPFRVTRHIAPTSNSSMHFIIIRKLRKYNYMHSIRFKPQENSWRTSSKTCEISLFASMRRTMPNFS